MTGTPPTQRLGDVCAVRKGTPITEKQAIPGDIPVVAGGMVPSYSHNRANRGAGAVTVSASGANAGFVAYWPQPIWASDCTTVEAAEPAQIHARYAYHFLKSIETTTIATLRRGAAQPHVYATDIQNLRIPLPPIDQQRRIAGILDASDALRTKRQDGIEKLELVVESTFVDLFIDGAGTWDCATIEQLAAPNRGSIRTGPFGSQLLHEEFTESGVAVLGIDNAVQNRFAWGERRFVSPEKYEQLKRYTVFADDVIVTIMGTCGRAAVVPPDIPLAINTKHLCCITLDRGRCSPQYLWAALLYHPAVRKQLGATRGAVMPGLNMGLIKQAEIPVPPRELQDRFVGLKSAIEQNLNSATTQDQALDLLFASLQQRAFRGEL